MQVLVHDPHVEPLVAELGTSVHPGTETNLVITRVEVRAHIVCTMHMVISLAIIKRECGGHFNVSDL